MLIFEVILFPLYLFLIFLFFSISNRYNFFSGIKITFLNLFIFALILYTLPVLLDSFFNSINNDIRFTFLIKSSLMVFFILFGFIFGERLASKRKVNQFSAYPSRLYSLRFWTIFFGVFCIIIFYINIQVNFGGIINFISLGYWNYVGEETDTNVASLLFALFPYVLIFNNKNISSNKINRFIAMFFSIIFIVLLLLGGRRNLALLAIIALIYSNFHNQSIKIPYIFFGTIFGILLMGFIAVFREYGVINVLSGKVSVNWYFVFSYISSFSRGELGTTFNFERYSLLIVENYIPPLSYGLSYILAPLFVIPRFLWPNRPLGLADHFAQNAFGSFDGFGYGYSPIYEAEVNFGFFWGITFILLGLFFGILNKHNKFSHYNVSIGIMSLLVLNFFRIDFSVVFKFFAMMWFFKVFFLTSLRINVVGLFKILF